MQPRLPLDQLLFETTFVVVDLETTGLRPGADRITEIGAVKTCRGERLGEFATLVHPGRPVPPAVTAVTGITDHLLRSAPPVDTVLGPFVEFVHGTVLVAHNARFDLGFLNAELLAHGWAPLDNAVLDTAALARRVLRDEVRSLRLAVLARHLRSRTVPTHRALPDARATVDVLHGLIERAGSLGATTVEDLQDLCRSRSDKAFRKRDLAKDAPASPGVYRFLDERGEVLYVGTSTNLRRRLRTYFGQDPRRRIADMVRETARVDWTVCPTGIESSVREVREIAAGKPRYNRRSRQPPPPAWIKLTREPLPRLSIVGAVRDDCLHIGPLSSRRVATELAEVLAEVAGLRPCSGRLRKAQDHAPCVLKELRRCAAPCDGTQSLADYEQVVTGFREAIDNDPQLLLTPLELGMGAAAAARRFEAARRVRDQVHLVAKSLLRLHLHAQLIRVEVLVAARSTDAGIEVVRIQRGRLVASGLSERADDGHLLDLVATSQLPLDADQPSGDEEVRLLLDWLSSAGVRVLEVKGTWTTAVGTGPLARRVAQADRLARRLRRDQQLLSNRKVTARAA